MLRLTRRALLLVVFYVFVLLALPASSQAGWYLMHPPLGSPMGESLSSKWQVDLVYDSADECQSDSVLFRGVALHRTFDEAQRIAKQHVLTGMVRKGGPWVLRFSREDPEAAAKLDARAAQEAGNLLDIYHQNPRYADAMIQAECVATSDPRLR